MYAALIGRGSMRSGPPSAPLFSPRVRHRRRYPQPHPYIENRIPWQPHPL